MRLGDFFSENPRKQPDAKELNTTSKTNFYNNATYTS